MALLDVKKQKTGQPKNWHVNKHNSYAILQPIRVWRYD
jgi:hypothetical protein